MRKKSRASLTAVTKIISSTIYYFRLLFQKRVFADLNRTLLVIAGAAGILFFGAAMAGSAGGSDPGSTGDPLVTRSYVEARINSRMQWQVSDLSPGQQLIGAAGTEFIVRVGSTVVVDPTGNGIPDVTGGTNVAAGQNAALNHHFIVPRTDGRGVIARTKAVVMYKGEVTVR